MRKSVVFGLSFFFLLFLSSSVMALNVESNTTLVTGINQRSLSCVNATEDVNIYCYLATNGNLIYQYYDNFTHIKTCDLNGVISGLDTVGAVNSTHTYIGVNKDIHLINMTSCGGEGSFSNALSGYNNLNLDYYETEQWLYTDRLEEVLDATDGSHVFYGDWFGYTAILENQTDNSTIWLNTYEGGDHTLIDFGGSISVDVNAIWGVGSLWYTMVKVSPSTTWLYTWEETGVSTQIFAYKINFSAGLGVTPTPIEEDTSFSALIVDIIQDGFNIETVTTTKLIIILIAGLLTGVFIVSQTSADPLIFIASFLAVFLIGWAIGWVETWLITLLGFCLIVIAFIKVKGG